MQQFRDYIANFREATVGFTHFESIIHDYHGDEVYPAAESGGTWMRSPGFVAEELRWAGIDLVSHASNHALDYGYGGLRSTWEALDAAGISHAGTGESLSEARNPTYLDASGGRVAAISMTTSFPRWSRAGQRGPDVRGRPGQNPLRYHYEVNPETLDHLRALSKQLGMWFTEIDDGVWVMNPPGLHNTTQRFIESDSDETRMVADENDVEANLRNIRDASRQADLVLVHVHTHEWHPDGTLSHPPDFVRSFGRECVDAGADIFLAQGSHAPLRGIEVHDGKPLIYDPGDLFAMSTTTTRLPLEFYERHQHNLDHDPWQSTPSDGYRARPAGYGEPHNPEGGYHATPVHGNFIAVCEFSDELDPKRVVLNPGTVVREPVRHSGIPVEADDQAASEIIEYVAELSAEFGTSIQCEDGVGYIEL